MKNIIWPLVHKFTLQNNLCIIKYPWGWMPQKEITEFKEKPRLDKFINIGYFVLKKELFRYLDDYNNYGDFLTFCGNNRFLKAFVHKGEHFTVNNVVELKLAEKNLNKINIF